MPKATSKEKPNPRTSRTAAQSATAAITKLYVPTRNTGAIAARIRLNTGFEGEVAKCDGLTAFHRTANTAGFVFQRMDEPIDVSETVSPWCSGCRNGGALEVCKKCVRAFCNECVCQNKSVMPVFRCPSCHHEKDKHTPYPLKYTGDITTRELWPPCVVTPLAVISFRLEGFPRAFGAAHTVYDRLQGYMQGNVALLELDFNLTGNANTVFQKNFAKLLHTLEHLVMQGTTRFAVYISSHSTPDTGLIHVAPENQGAVSVTEFFNVIFNERFQKIVKNKSSMLTLLLCGGLVSNPETREELRLFSECQLFQQIITFSQPNFMAAFAVPLLQEFALHYFVFGKEKIGAVLHEQSSLGAHTTIVEFINGAVTQYVWTHPGIRPMGEAVPLQCVCGRLKPWKVTVSKDLKKVTLKCKPGCLNELTYPAPKDVTWEIVLKDDPSNSAGAWFKKKIEKDVKI